MQNETWKVTMQNDEHAAIFNASDADDLVAEVWGADRARVIAAAPDLLEQAMRLLAVVEDLGDGVDVPDWAEVARDARFLIKKATGQEAGA